MKEQPCLPLRIIDASSIRWKPKPNITAYELALALPLLLLGQGAQAQALTDLPATTKRHFKFKLISIKS
jgi:hypothetical protein